jgi:hypothetical protein
MTDLTSLLAPLRDPLRLVIPAGFAIAGAIGIRAWKMEETQAGRLSRGLLHALKIFRLGAVVWFALELTGGLFHWQTPAPLALPAFLGAAALHLAFFMRVVERPLSPWPSRLRLASLGLMVFLLAEPAYTWLQDLRAERKVVLLFDDSSSMRAAPDPAMPPPLVAAVGAVRQSPAPDQPNFLDALAQTHDPVLRRFALASSSLSPEDLAALPNRAAESNDFSRLASDLSAALGDTAANTPKGWLKGVVLFSDGRHTGGGSVEDVARRLGAQGVPVFPVLPPDAGARPDAALVNVRHPDSIFESDRARFAVTVQAQALRGKTLTVQVRQGDRVAAEKQVPVPEDDFRAEVNLVDIPTDKGILDYEVSVSVDGEDLYPENNRRPLRLAVSDDRYQVLLLDRLPRWEFRYLRNLFHARDKSVQLQYVLTEPDVLTGRERPEIEASPRRPFGESEATRLPAKVEDWKPFDVVVLGDVPPDILTAEQWEVLRHMVANQGALLVLISGPAHLPAAYAGHPLAELMPLDLSAGVGRAVTEDFRFTVSRAGLKHPVLRLDDDETRSADLWRRAPPGQWRLANLAPKPGAEVLLFARPDLRDLAAAGGTANVDAMLERMRLRDKEERDHALVLWNGWGKGKVVMLNFDATWRLRYGVGDTYHHKFWGQVLRWGAGPRLRAGSERIRLGTDKLVYAPGESIQVLARATAEDHTLRQLGDLRVSLGREGEAPSVVSLRRGEEYSGLFQHEVSAPAQGGLCRITLDIPEALRDPDGPSQITTEVLVSETQRWAEMTDLTPDKTLLGEIARLSGGEVVTAERLPSVLAALQGDDPRTQEVRSRPIWNHPAVLTLLLALLTAEWYLRRRHSLP